MNLSIKKEGIMTFILIKVEYNEIFYDKSHIPFNEKNVNSSLTQIF